MYMQQLGTSAKMVVDLTLPVDYINADFFSLIPLKKIYIVFIVKKPKGSLTSTGKYVLKMSIFHEEMVI